MYVCMYVCMYGFEKQYQTLKKVFPLDIQTLPSCLTNSAALCLFNTLLSVSISDETLFLVFDIFKTSNYSIFDLTSSCFSNKLQGHFCFLKGYGVSVII